MGIRDVADSELIESQLAESQRVERTNLPIHNSPNPNLQIWDLVEINEG